MTCWRILHIFQLKKKRSKIFSIHHPDTYPFIVGIRVTIYCIVFSNAPHLGQEGALGGHELVVNEPLRQEAVLIRRNPGGSWVKLREHAALAKGLEAVVACHPERQTVGKPYQQGLPQGAYVTWGRGQLCQHDNSYCQPRVSRSNFPDSVMTMTMMMMMVMMVIMLVVVHLCSFIQKQNKQLPAHISTLTHTRTRTCKGMYTYTH
jgi:hypothetical protein